jgi:hypothetical protein
MLVGVTGDSARVQRRAYELAEAYLADPTSLPATLATTVLRVAAFSGDAGLYDKYVALLERLSPQPEDYYRLFGAVSWFRDPALVARSLELAMTPGIRTQDKGALLGGLLSRPWAAETAWEFVKENWSRLTAALGTFQGIPTILGSLGDLCSERQAADVRLFFTASRTASYGRTLQRAVERIENCAAIRARQSAVLAKWLEASSR